jgi:hypothetical protein
MRFARQPITAARNVTCTASVIEHDNGDDAKYYPVVALFKGARDSCTGTQANTQPAGRKGLFVTVNRGEGGWEIRCLLSCLVHHGILPFAKCRPLFFI